MRFCCSEKKNPHFTLTSQIGKTEMNNTHKMCHEVNFVADVTAHRHVNNAVCPPVVPHSWNDPGWRGDRLICPSVLLKEWACREPIKTIANRSCLYITTHVFVPFLGVKLEVSIKIIPFLQMRKLRTKGPDNLANKQQSLETSGHHSTLLHHVTVKGSSLWPWSTAPCLFNGVTVLHERILNKWSRLRSKMGEGEWIPDISLLRSSSSWADTIFFFPASPKRAALCGITVIWVRKFCWHFLTFLYSFVLSSRFLTLLNFLIIFCLLTPPFNTKLVRSDFELHCFHLLNLPFLICLLKAFVYYSLKIPWLNDT